MKKRASRKSKKPLKREKCTYCIEILDWEMPYHLSLSPRKDFSPGPYWEHISLKLDGKLLYPEKLVDINIQIDILGDREKALIIKNPENCHYEPKAVGALMIRGKQRDFLGSVPFDVLPSICFMLQHGKIKFLVLSGQSLYRGSADIESMYFEKNYNPEDWM